MITGDTCTDCGIEMEYAGQRPRPSGYAIVYECPSCGATATDEASEDDLRESQRDRRL